ncbi:MAG: cobalamin-dependent protein, partial [Thermoanaerobaculia bacterium]
MSDTDVYRPEHPVRIVTATSLFDGHDASINVMRRILQASGVEVIHLGHNRSVEEIVRAALQEDAQGVAVSSYQGGHMEFFKYLRQRLDEEGLDHVKIYGGGGGTIVPREIEELQEAGVERIFSPEDGRDLGLQGMINQVVRGCDFKLDDLEVSVNGSFQPMAREITRVENGRPEAEPEDRQDAGAATGENSAKAPVVGLTGTGGAGKSSLTDELVRRFLSDFGDKQVAVICVDPTRRRTGGALLGDRIRFNSLKSPRVFMRSLATRGAKGELSESLADVLAVAREKFDLVWVETAGIGQGDSAVADLCDLSVYVMTSEYGAPSQLEKIEMLDFADLVVINKFTRRGSEDALRDVRKQYQRNHQLFDTPGEELPVFGTNAAQFNDSGVNSLYGHLIAKLEQRLDLGWGSRYPADGPRVSDTARTIIPPDRERYLSDVAGSCREYRAWAGEQAEIAGEVEALRVALRRLGVPASAEWDPIGEPGAANAVPAANAANAVPAELVAEHDRLLAALDPGCRQIVEEWQSWDDAYQGDEFSYRVRDREIRVANYRQTLSGTRLRKVARPRFRAAADRLYWRLLENVP